MALEKWRKPTVFDTGSRSLAFSPPPPYRGNYDDAKLQARPKGMHKSTHDKANFRKRHHSEVKADKGDISLE